MFRVYIADFSGITKEELDSLKHLQAWLERIKARPAVQRGVERLQETGVIVVDVIKVDNN